MTDKLQQYMALNVALMTGLAAIERVAWNPGASVLNYISPLLAGGKLAAEMIEAGDDASKYIEALAGTYAVEGQPSREQLDGLNAATGAERERRAPKEPTPENLDPTAEQAIAGDAQVPVDEPVNETSPAVEPVVPLPERPVDVPERKPLE